MQGMQMPVSLCIAYAILYSVGRRAFSSGSSAGGAYAQQTSDVLFDLHTNFGLGGTTRLGHDNGGLTGTSRPLCEIPLNAQPVVVRHRLL
ncbi:hypothetical protein CABS01_10687 [Colletotrichum abscissum]|uniref:Uncharacterized protein n=1 Tax=Colletotrichum costaricense TaxID=1209916 RepID=A0AAI9YTI4_9PEZI|nr:uncharacterized protein CCOS01_08848 [Colletotrichum costaricense]XP_060398766.1 uncharacterized protein CABS01_10687 [Colletotrichum abscissum]KAK1497709.1 hypothetical protein CABS01_10687 [Colletotrichum abscissum]KAK1523761.1 hypothetical protein CCOS01_08848 [Colletotrichum costaricense]